MDDQRFDDLTRRLAQGISRRAAVKGGVAAFLSAVGLRGDGAAQVTQAQCGNQICAANPGACKPGCVCCVYGNGNSRCRPAGSCGGGTVACPAGQTYCPALERCAACCGDADCDDGFACTTNACVDGNCVFTPDDARCNDANACTTDTCAPGAAGADPATGCLISPVVCSPGQACDPATGACACPAGFEALNGGCFAICNGPGAQPCGCLCFGLIDGSNNNLCVRQTGQACATTSTCPAGQACYRVTNRCVAAC